jgi:hypothetical protein
MLAEEEERVLKSLPYRDNSEFFDPRYIEVDRILAEREERVRALCWCLCSWSLSPALAVVRPQVAVSL